MKSVFWINIRIFQDTLLFYHIMKAATITMIKDVTSDFPGEKWKLISPRGLVFFLSSFSRKAIMHASHEDFIFMLYCACSSMTPGSSCLDNQVEERPWFHCVPQWETKVPNCLLIFSKDKWQDKGVHIYAHPWPPGLPYDNSQRNKERQRNMVK